MPSDTAPAPHTVTTGLARSLGGLLLWAGAFVWYPAFLALASLHFGWIEVTIGGVPAETVERAVWATFGAGMACTSFGMTIRALARIRDRAVSGPL